MGNGENAACGIFILGIVALGYSLYMSQKVNKCCTKLDISVDELSEKADVYVSDAIVREAVDQAARREADKAARTAITTVIDQIHRDIQKEVKTAVDDACADLRGKVEQELNRQIGNIDISSIRRDVVKKAGEKASEKFESDLESILEKYNSDLNNVSKIYNSIAKSVASRDDGKEMIFRIA